MIMEGTKAFQRYLALKLHFTSDYDYFRYGGKTRAATNESFDKRKDSFFFRKLERRYSDEDLTNFFVSNFVEGSKVKWVGDLSSIESEKIYMGWKKKMQSFSYMFEQDLLIAKDKMKTENPADLWEPIRGEHPEILKLYLGKKINIETMIASNVVLNYLPKWDRDISDSIIWPDVSKYIRKYSPFITVNKKELIKTMRKVFVS
jgi:hypothetical protein